MDTIMAPYKSRKIVQCSMENENHSLPIFDEWTKGSTEYYTAFI